MYDFTINEMPLVFASNVEKVKVFLNSCGLSYENMELYAGVFDASENLIAGGGFSRNVIKCIAINDEYRDSGIASVIISYLRSRVFAKGYPNLFIFTKLQYEHLFSSLSFYPVGHSQKCVLLESSVNGISRFCANLSQSKGEGTNGCLICNCNPCTNGHLYLIDKAAKQVDNLHVILLSDDDQYFNYVARYTMLKNAVAHIPNVKIHHGGNYIISRATFPTYFLKEASDAARNHIYLDLDIFATHIAPALDITVRFVGTEKLDAATAQYNEIMKSYLPSRNIQVVEMERLTFQGADVSASRVRELLKKRRFEEIASLVPQATFEYLTSLKSSK